MKISTIIDQQFLEKQRERTSFTRVLGNRLTPAYTATRRCLAISEFAVRRRHQWAWSFGEKFRLAVEFAMRKKWPLISVCTSGGARLYEGIVALMQMTKTVAAVDRMKKAGLPFISILADPSTGGAIASYAALGDVCLAEPGALVIFTGPRGHGGAGASRWMRS